MATKYRARLQFVENGPAVEGDWAVPDTAQDQYTEWVGLYGASSTVVIKLIKETDGREHVSRKWTAEGEV
ncbi:hypothetical protein [Streptomyces sp. NPDC059513]|uniref:hypothetical protein n=1 Tax=unclassified Streptomyces TaxID=2593676 RepID=UPI00368DE366